MPSKTADLWWLFTRQTVKVTQRESVLTASMLMQRRNFRHLPVVTETGRIAGMISAQDVIDSLNLVLSPGSLHSSQIIQALMIPVERIMTHHSICVEPGDGLTEITKKLAYHNLGALPLIDEQGIVHGIITLRDLIGLIGTSSEPIGVPVSEVMNSKAITIEQNSLVSTAVRLMSEKRIRRLPIVTTEGKILGMLTNKDILGRLAKFASRSLSGQESREEFDISISEFMTKDVIGISQDDDIRVAASTMMIFGIGGLVINDIGPGQVALVTERDIIRTLSRKKGIDLLVNAMQFELELEKSVMRNPGMTR